MSGGPGRATETATPQAAEFLVELLADADVVIRTDAATWAAMAREAVRQGVLPLFHTRLRRLPPGTVPEGVAAAVHERFTHAALRSSLILRELELIVDTCSAHDIPVLLLKGLHLVADVYEAPTLRTMGDVDILVPRDRLDDAGRALADAGFDATPVAELAEFCRTNSHLPRMAPPGGLGLGLEVHWNIELPTSPFDIVPAELWAAARPLRINDRDVLVLSPEHLILHLCLHACYHHRFDHTPLKQLCDIAAVLRRYEGEIDWELLAGMAERWRIQAFVRFTLLLTRAVLRVRLPESVQSLPADTDEERLLGNARAYILNRTLVVPPALSRVIRARGVVGKIRAAIFNVFPPPARLAAIYGLKRGSLHVALWYVVRPLDLLIRKGRATVRLLNPAAAGRRLRYSEHNRVQLKNALRAWSTRPPAA
jgi:hypothetical protein